MKPIAVVVLAIVFVLGVQAQTDQKFETHRKQALTLYDLGRHTEALPLISDLLNSGRTTLCYWSATPCA
jgi:hypothetical protein